MTRSGKSRLALHPGGAQEQEVDVAPADIDVHELRAPHVIRGAPSDTDFDAENGAAPKPLRAHGHLFAIVDFARERHAPEEESRMSARHETKDERSDFTNGRRRTGFALDDVDAILGQMCGTAKGRGGTRAIDARTRRMRDGGDIERVIEVRMRDDDPVGAGNVSPNGSEVGTDLPHDAPPERGARDVRVHEQTMPRILDGKPGRTEPAHDDTRSVPAEGVTCPNDVGGVHVGSSYSFNWSSGNQQCR